MSEYLDKVKKYVPDCNEAAVAGIVKHLGIALRSRDASLVSCSSKDELARVRDSWCKKKLGLDHADAELDKMINDVCTAMKADQRKDRVTFYYLLAQKADKVSALV
jgi:hypothetical protein